MGAGPEPTTSAGGRGPTRRRWLRLGLGGGVALAIGGVAAALWRPQARRTPPAALRTLDAGSWQVLAAVAAVVCPGGGGAPSADEIGVATKVDALIATVHPATAAEIRQLLGLLENPASGLLLDGRLGSFSGADAVTQARILAGWRDSGVAVKRAGYKALSGLCASAYFADPRVFAAIGYPGPPNYGNRPSVGPA